eukprot:5768171-Prymnesium_polylepis.1
MSPGLPSSKFHVVPLQTPPWSAWSKKALGVVEELRGLSPAARRTISTSQHLGAGPVACAGRPGADDQ